MAIAFDERIIFQSPIMRLTDIRWVANEQAPTEEGAYDFSEITFQRTGMFVKNYGRAGVLCDPNTLLLLNAREPYCLSHPVTVRCACTALLIRPDVLADMIRETCGGVADRHERLFPVSSSPLTTEMAVAHFGLFTQAIRPDPPDPLAFEELGLSLAGKVAANALTPRISRSLRRRMGTARAHEDAVRTVRAILSQTYHMRLALSELARQVHFAPHYLCRIFREHVGTSIYQYLARIRLAAALRLMAETSLSLTQLAARVGFSHQSHFCNVFRRTFGTRASAARRAMKSASLHEMRTILQV